ncbi:hypothetical protein HYU11_03345 [Candidatus Woesearchaeota archaeon]|nr:hypothetical protein [Candidatus Woesearchaeota archaeon]
MAGEEELLKRYRRKLEEEFSQQASSRNTFSANYVDFKKEFLPKHLSAYEKLCNLSEKILKINPDKKSTEDLTEQLELCHLGVTPAGVYSLAILSGIVIFVAVSLTGFLLFGSIFFIAYALIVASVILAALIKLPEFFGNSWRLKASNQMVQSIFYVSTYMRHTSNLELAIMFASDHLSPPLSIDLKKVLWDVETERYGSIKESLDNYLERWKKWNPEFIESFHLIEGSLFESSEERRLSMVDKALNVMLEETYEKMLRYAHDLKGPITMLYMLGIILPILGLVILPLVASFMTNEKGGLDSGQLALYLILLYNITMPLGIFYLSKIVLSKRPTGYGETDISEENPELRKYRNCIIKVGNNETAINPIYISIAIITLFLLIGLSPILVKLVVPKELLVSGPDAEGSVDIFKKMMLDYRLDSNDNLIGPYGIGAAIISFLIPLAFGVGIGIYYSVRSSKVVKFRENTKKLEDEYASALFQLGNRLGDGMPAEIAFGKVAETTRGSASGDFFALVSINIRKKGMGIQQAIFDPIKGALIYFPSSIIESSMKVLLESSRKGPLIASQALINVSEYIKQINRVNERLRDLMADVISDMKQQTHILAPAIAAIVVGITSMIVTILGNLNQQIGKIGTDTPTQSLKGVVDIFGQGIPTYYFQIIVGIYIVEIVYILTILTNGIENGADHLSEENNLGKNLTRSTILYSVISAIVVIAFNLIAAMIMQTLTPM